MAERPSSSCCACCSAVCCSYVCQLCVAKDSMSFFIRISLPEFSAVHLTHRRCSSGCWPLGSFVSHPTTRGHRRQRLGSPSLRQSPHGCVDALAAGTSIRQVVTLGGRNSFVPCHCHCQCGGPPGPAARECFVPSPSFVPSFVRLCNALILPPGRTTERSLKR
jgi:hypothetical protein